MEYNQKMLEAKRKLLERFKKKGKIGSGGQRERLPPGQHLTRGFPVLDLGVHPRFNPQHWRFQVEGEVEEPLDLGGDEFCQMAKKEQVADFHCVTTWSKYDIQWGGVKFLDLAVRVNPTDAARFVIMHCADGYTTNLPIEDCMDEDVMLAYELYGEPLSLEHGGPVRMVVPKLYAWKSAKFLRRVVFAPRDEPGYWEVRGYHKRGDPWLEERYG